MINELVPTSKLCAKCFVEKEMFEFSKGKDNNDGLQIYCKSCNRDYRIKNKEKINEYIQKYRVDNKEKIVQCCKEYYSNNREECLLRNKKYHANPETKIKRMLYINNHNSIPQNRMIYVIRNSIRRGFKGGSKSARTEKLLGCPFAFFIDYIMSKCPPNFTMENFGEVWVLDHVVPISHFDMSDPQQVAKGCHYSNFQPLSREDNLIKSDTIEIVRRDVYIFNFK